MNSVQSVDWSLFHLLNSLAGHSRAADFLLRLCAQELEYVLLFLLATLWVTPAETVGRTFDRQRLVVYAILAALIALGVNQLIGLAWFRPRPFAYHQVTLLLPRSPDSAFPSDHAAGGFALAVSVLLTRDRWARHLGWSMLALAGLLAFARVYAGTHYPFDVIVGGLIGAVCAALVWGMGRYVEPLLDWLLQPLHQLTTALIARLGMQRWRILAR